MKKYIIALLVTVYVFFSVNVLFAATYSQADLTGTWNFNLLRTGAENMWMRAQFSINSSGVVTCVSMSDSGGGTTCPEGFDLTFTMNETTGVITQSGYHAANAGTDHITMTLNKNFAAGTSTTGDDPNYKYQLVIMQKVVPGTTYSNADLQNKDFVWHEFYIGRNTGWNYAIGKINDSREVILQSEIDSCCGEEEVLDPPEYTAVFLSVDNAGVVTMSGTGAGNVIKATCKGFLSADKKTIVVVYHDDPESEGGAGSEYSLKIIQITGQTYTVGPLPAGTSVAHMLGSGAANFWVHYINTVSSGGVMNFSQWVASNGMTAPEGTFTGSLDASGTLTVAGNPTYHGQVSHDGTFTVGTQTGGTGPYVYMLNVTTKKAPDFKVNVANLYYDDTVRTVNKYNFSFGAKSGDTIIIPDGFVTKPSGESALSYTFGLFPQSTGLSLSWDGSNPCTLAAYGDTDGAAIIATTPTLPDASSAQTVWDYKVKLQNFAITNSTVENEVYVGMGNDGVVNQPTIVVSWLADGRLQLAARVGDSDSPLWPATPVSPINLGVRTPATTILNLRVQNTGTAINFYYTLNSGAETLIGTFGSGDGYVQANYKGFPALFPFVNLEADDAYIEDPFIVQSSHYNRAGGNTYYAAMRVNDPDAIYESITVASSGTACGDNVPTTALTYNGNGQWHTTREVFLGNGPTPPACFPQYIFTAVKKESAGGGSVYETRTITAYVTEFATGLQPTGTVSTATPTFSWTGISGAKGYWVQLMDSQYGSQIWGTWVESPTISIVYPGGVPDAPALVSGTTYYYSVNSNVETGGMTNLSIAEGSFTYSSAAQQPLYGSFTGTGIWQWGGSAWTQLTPDNPESIVAAGTNLYGKFANGIWQWTGSGWTHLTPDRPASMVASGTNLYGNFTGNGIWKWGGSGWTQLTPDNPESMVAAGSNLYGKFGNGIWQWTGSGWTKLTPDRPAEMVAAGSNLYGNFTGNGIWQWSGTNWTQLTPDNPESMVAGGTNLYGKFANGVWQWTGSGWNKLTPDKPASMAAAGNILYGTFTGNGVWQWNGTNWTQLTPDNPAMMAVGE